LTWREKYVSTKNQTAEGDKDMKNKHHTTIVA
jgi:hypothetical protein